MASGLRVQASDKAAGDTEGWETRAENAKRRHCLIGLDVLRLKACKMFNLQD